MRGSWAVLALVIVLGGCGALFNNGPAKVMFTSQPSEAEVWIDGNRFGTTPLVVDLSKKKSYTVSFRKDGFDEQVRTLNNKVSPTYVVLDILGGLVPVIVDAATGAWYVLEADNVQATLPARSGQLDGVQLELVRRGEVRPAFFIEQSLR